MESEHQMEYIFSFVKAGFFAVVRQWLLYGCAEAPEEMARLILQVTAPIPEGLPAPQYDQW